MNYGSICSGVEAATLAWAPPGWKAKFFAEVEPFPAAVLQQKLDATRPLRPLDPATAADEKDRKLRESWAKQIAELPESGTLPNLGDFTLIKKNDYKGQIDLLVGGTLCQKPEEECPDAPRYKACGNSMRVNVMAQIGERIDEVEKTIPSREGIDEVEKEMTLNNVVSDESNPNKGGIDE